MPTPTLLFFDMCKNETNWSIFTTLLNSREPLPGDVIRRIVDKPQQTVSRILMEFHKLGFLERTDYGRRVLYSINDLQFWKIVDEMGAMGEYRRKLASEKAIEERENVQPDDHAEWVNPKDI